MTKVQKITGKQQEILKLIYSYRFLNRIQIQGFLGHKDYKTINMWLKDLYQNQYLGRIYTDDFVGRTKPAIYYLGLKGIQYLTSLHYVDRKGVIGKEVYSIEQLRKRYKEATRSQAYIDRCLLLAACSLGYKRADTTTTQYVSTTQADYAQDNDVYHFLTDSDLASQLGPQLVITRQKGKKFTATYFLEVFDTNLPRFRVKNRLKQYITFLSEGDWEAERKDETLPIILLICPRTSDLIYAKRRTRGLMANAWYDDTERPRIAFTTTDKLRTADVLDKIWEQA